MRSINAKARWFFLLCAGFSSCGRNIKLKRVVPAMAKAANNPKSCNRSVWMKINPMKEPMVVIHPSNTGFT